MIGSYEQAAIFLKNIPDPLLICHKSPDGDTIGSAFALYYALLSIGKDINIVCEDEWPEKFSYIYPKNISSKRIGTPITVDVASPQLLGDSLEKYGDDIALCIDHHTENSIKAKECLIDKNAAATAEVVFSLLNLLKVDISPIIANCLYTGLSTDTGCFRYSNCTPNTHKVAAALIEKGANAAEINRKMFEIKSLGSLKLEKVAIDNLELLNGGKVAFSFISREDYISSGAVPSDYDGLPAILRSIEGTELAIMLKEQKNGELKASVRTSEAVDAAEFCKQFGGGGHSRAAGCSFTGSISDVKIKLCESAIRWVEI